MPQELRDINQDVAVTFGDEIDVELMPCLEGIRVAIVAVLGIQYRHFLTIMKEG